MSNIFVRHIFILLVGYCSWTFGEEAVDKNNKIESDRFNEFDWSLCKAISTRSTGNVVLSPISVKLVLAMLYEGAKGNTSKQLEEVLQISPLKRSFTAHKFSSILKSLQEPNTGYDITIGTKLFIDNEAKPKDEFENKMISLYNATIEKINFQNTLEAVQKINTWAEAVSKGHIKHLVTEADTRESTIMLLLNAVYFKGLWEKQFPANETVEEIFHVDVDTAIKVPFMKAAHTMKYTESGDLRASILRLPYMGGKFAMYIVLPFDKNGLGNVIASITPDKMRALIPTMLEVPVQISLPKFQFEFAASLAPVLKQLGITDMFDKNANLTEIAEGPKELVVSNVIQKAGINVNEQGSTAYASTVIDLTSKFGDPAIDFNASHPFLFFIEDETTNTIVFVGKVIDPSGVGKSKVQNQVYVKGDINVNEYNGSQTSLIDQQTFSYFDIELAQSLNNLGFENWITSPSSIKTVMGLVLEGAEGTTLQQLSYALRLPIDKVLAKNRLRTFHAELQKGSKNAIMKSINKIIVQNGITILPTYKTIVTEKYGVEIENVDMKVPAIIANKINAWVNNITRNLIPQLVDPDMLNAETSLVFLNAIYFKGEWKVPFDPKRTHISCFHGINNECKKTDFMQTVGFFKYGYIPSLGARILELPYSEPRYSLVILLPLHNNGLQQTIRNLPFNSLFPILDTIPFVELSVTLPKFTMEFSIDIVPVLQRLGAVDMFTDKANLDDMITPTKKTKVTGVIHKAKIIVNEKGTEAAAATAVFAETLMSRQAVNFNADHPFIFFIRDTHTGFLFEGVYSNPMQVNNGLPLNSDSAKVLGGQNNQYPRPAAIKNKVQNKRY